MDTKQFIKDHLFDDVRELALKYHDNAKVDMALALRQIEARQLLQKKVPSWSANDELLFPPHLSIEQCSSEATAQYKASLLQGNSFADLTGGLGVDCFFIAQHFPQADYVEQNQELCALAKHNFASLNTPIQVHNDTAENYLNTCKTIDCIFLDPARRDACGRKTVSIADCTPNILDLQDRLLQKARRVMLKLSPMLDINKALLELRHVKEIHVVAVANECKELLFVLEPDYAGSPLFTCVNLSSEQPAVLFTQQEERDSALCLASEVSQYLYEPNAALMKGGCFKLLTQRYNLYQLHPNSHLYTSEHRIPDFPGRVFQVEGWAPFNKRIKQTLLTGVEKASIATRNFPLSVAELRKTWKIAEGDQVFLFATTLSNEKLIVVKTHKTFFC
ncbi:MAG: SAM-dependent methyltransferase [Bacteroidales bacterium]|nr:SAM-dependent methyltransferase [Bacteroidales bacterium]